MYPDGPHTEPDDWGVNGSTPPDKEVCVECLDEGKIQAEWEKLVNGHFYITIGNNCSTVIAKLMEAGQKPPRKPPTCKGRQTPRVENSCAGNIFGGFPGIDRPGTFLEYFECMSKKKCDPWRCFCEEYVYGECIFL